MKYLGIDYGTKHIGIAVSDENGSIAFPRGVETNDARVLDRIAEFVKEERIEQLVVGDTRTFSGVGNTITPEAEAFAHELSLRTSIPLQMASEAWSSREASRFTPENQKNDSAAAAVILQRFLDMRQSRK